MDMKVFIELHEFLVNNKMYNQFLFIFTKNRSIYVYINKIKIHIDKIMIK